MLIAYGLAALVVVWTLFSSMRPFAVTLGLFALVTLGVGAMLVFRTDTQVEALLQQLSTDAALFHAEEGARMAAIQKTFVILEYIELTTLIAGSLVAFFMKHDTFISGIALGCVFSAAFLLCFDITAERRGAVYFHAINAQPRDRVPS